MFIDYRSMKEGDLGLYVESEERAWLAEAMNIAKDLTYCRQYVMAKNPRTGRFFVNTQIETYGYIDTDKIKALRLDEVDFDSIGRLQGLLDKVDGRVLSEVACRTA